MDIYHFYQYGRRVEAWQAQQIIKSQLLYRLSYGLPRAAEHRVGFASRQHNK